MAKQKGGIPEGKPPFAKKASGLLLGGRLMAHRALIARDLAVFSMRNRDLHLFALVALSELMSHQAGVLFGGDGRIAVNGMRNRRGSADGAGGEKHGSGDKGSGFSHGGISLKIGRIGIGRRTVSLAGSDHPMRGSSVLG